MGGGFGPLSITIEGWLWYENFCRLLFSMDFQRDLAAVDLDNLTVVRCGKPQRMSANYRIVLIVREDLLLLKEKKAAAMCTLT